MKSNHELENCLTKAISKFEVRDMLTKFGIPEDAEVTLKMQLDENSEPIASCSVPTTNKKEHISCGSISLISLEELLVDDFINQAIKTLDLSNRIADVDSSTQGDENKLIIYLSSKNPNYTFNFSVRAYCCIVGCGKCCKYCR